MKQALIFQGGWDGHTPAQTAEVLAGGLRGEGFAVEVINELTPLADGEKLKTYDLIVPVWTMGQMAKEQWQGLNAAIKSGVGLGGVHGGAGDAFRGTLEYQWMVGGQFVGHPHVGEYVVNLTSQASPITAGMKKRFDYNSEQYYMLVDPGNTVLATTNYTFENRKIKMPVVWTKPWGAGRVFYSALGHVAAEFGKFPEVLAMTIRGLVWAAR